jgi:peptidoglycan/LPS O-acetylase OafA/YrhL
MQHPRSPSANLKPTAAQFVAECGAPTAADATFSKNEDIEALRAIAVLLAVSCHLGDLFNPPGTHHSLFRFTDFWGGVDIFFCVSGFVITGSLLRLGTPHSFRHLAVPFYIRRIFRIWPAALLWLSIALLAAKFANTSSAFGHFRADAHDGVAAVLQIHNIYLSLCGTGHLAPCGKEVIYWSLSLEEQFYVLFPILLYFVAPMRLRWVLAGLILIQFPLARDAPDMLWFIRTDAISYGVLIAIAASRGQLDAVVNVVSNHPLRARWLVVLLVVTVAALSLAPQLKVNVGLIALTSAGLVLLASCNRGVVIPRRNCLRSLLLWGGSRSFGIYLAHDPCFWATREIFYRIYHGAQFDNPLGLAVTGAGLVVLSVEATYRIVETPIRRFGHRLSNRFMGPGAQPQRVQLSRAGATIDNRA